MAYVYRCSKCRTRNTFRHALEWYIRPKRCRCCGHKAFYVDKERVRRKPCYCEGYHYPHRPGTTFCVVNPQYQVNVRTMRYGEKLGDVLLDMYLREQCPF